MRNREMVEESIVYINGVVENWSQWHTHHKKLTKAMEDALSLIKELTEENERLEAQVKMWTSTAYCEKDRAESIKADTIREMQERLKGCRVVGSYGIHCYFKDDVDQIAKEMLEGNK